ncbi:hypothetical protein GCM10007391_05280 [Alteromonas halophila]|uniref:Uncharacterized protein n=1 Tax=Alteromonas halophila TaxID=516698 RepID=A0A918JDM0_9ALTE|nr:hypothetical protein GCM10007391_05280 [Alteromonas halophila]
MQQSVFHIGGQYFNVIAQLELAFKITLGDPFVQVLAFATLFLFGLFLTGNGQRIFLHLNVDVVFAEAGNRHGNAIFILT